jgi:hypothetical protein
MKDAPVREGRRRFLRGLGAAVLGAAVAPTAARTLRIAPAADDAGGSADDGDRARPGMRWIGHF